MRNREDFEYNIMVSYGDSDQYDADALAWMAEDEDGERTYEEYGSSRAFDQAVEALIEAAYDL